ncbi:MAG: hypothetical protein M1812_007811 [Candelaria pacifica]|nr:MAG: hypothetical protein M1812_007811 [Candelaria pacifica]
MGLLQRIKLRRSPPPEVASHEPAEKNATQTSDNKKSQAEGIALTGDDIVIGANAPVPDTSLGIEKEREGVIETGIDSGQPAITKPESANDENGQNAEGGDVGEDETKYPGGWALGILTFGLCLALFVVALDNTIIATAIPVITTRFNSLNDVGWYGSSYLLTTTSLQPSFGKVYTYFSVKWTFLSALVIFELGSIICAAARNSVMLIVGRAVAGAGAAALFSGGMTIIGFSVPIRKRPIYIALLSSMFGISSVVGPILGGALTDKASWRWCFWINLPFGGVALLTVFFFFKNPERKENSMTFKQKIKEIDLLGAFFLICSIVCLLLALQWGGSTYPWNDSRVYGCIIGFGLLVAVFVGLQIKQGDRATIPTRIFLRQRTVFTSCWYSSFLSMGVYTHIYYLPFYFQAVKGTTAEGSGIRTIPYLVTITLASIVIGGSITTFGWYTPFMWFGAAVFTIGAAMLSTLKVGSSAGRWIGYQILAGTGAGAGIQIPFISIQAVLNSKDMPTGNALAIFFNSLGGAISISVAQNIFSNTLIQQIPLLAPDVNPATIIAAGATHVKEVTPSGSLDGVLQAYSIAVDRAFIMPIAVGGIAFLFSLFVEWKSVKGKKLMPGGG